MLAADAWIPFDTAVRAYIQEFADLSAEAASELMTVPQWVQRGDRYVRERRPIYFVAQSVADRAFWLKSFPLLQSESLRSPLKDYFEGRAISAGTHTYLDVRDVAIRMAFRSIKTSPDGSQTFDKDSMEADLQSLHSLVESETVRMEMVGIVVGAQVGQSIDLRRGLSISSLTSSEVSTFFTLSTFPMTVNQGTGEPEILLPAPIAAVRLTIEHRRDKPYATYEDCLFREFDSIADAIALHHEVRPALFLWRQWVADEFLRGSYVTSPSLGTGIVSKTIRVESPTPIVEAYAPLSKLRRADKYANVSLAVRRMCQARTRTEPEDILLDTMIALEALLLSGSSKERGELAFRAALRAAQWAATLGKEPSDVFDLVSCGYRLRNDVVHGGSFSKDASVDVGGRTESCSEVVAHVALLARAFGLDALAQIGRGHFDMKWGSRLKASLKALE